MRYRKTSIMIIMLAIVGLGIVLVSHQPSAPLHRYHKPPVTQPGQPTMVKASIIRSCVPKRTGTAVTTAQQQRIIDDVRAMSSYTGSQDSELYSILKSNYYADVQAYDVCQLKTINP